MFSHGLTDTFIPISFFSLSTIHLLRTQILTPVFWIFLNEKTLVLETLSRSRWQKHFLLESNSVGNRTSCWLAVAASGFLMRDLLWNTPWCSFLVTVHRRESKSWDPSRDWDPYWTDNLYLMFQSISQTLLWVERQWEFESIRERMKRKSKRKEMWSRKTRKHASSISRSDMTTRTKNDCFAYKTYDLSHAKCSREKFAFYARLMGCAIRRFSDTFSCNGLLRACLSFCFWFEFECITVISKFHGSRTGIPSMRKSVSRENFQNPLNCGTCVSVSCTSSLLEQTCDFRVRTMFSCEIRVLKQSQSALFSSITHFDNIVCIPMCDECMKSIDSDVCHRLWSIS